MNLSHLGDGDVYFNGHKIGHAKDVRVGFHWDELPVTMREEVIVDVFGPLSEEAAHAERRVTRLYAEDRNPQVDPSLELRLAHALWVFLRDLNRAADRPRT